MTAPTAIHLRVHDVGMHFLGLTQALRDSPEYAAQANPECIVEEFDRFKIWAANISAHREGQQSLENRLRDAAHLKDHTISLLDELQRSLERVGQEQPWDSFSDSNSESGSDASSDNGEESELKQLLGGIRSSVTCLFRLSMAIRDPAPDDRLQSTLMIEKSYYEEHDILHAKCKYPICADYLSNRVGRAISSRRQYLSYQELHHEKLAKNVELIGLEQPSTEHTSSGTELTTILNTHSGMFTTFKEDDEFSMPSYATSVNATVRVPPLPDKAHDNEWFECPLCYRIVAIDNEVAWKKHVYQDLHAYSCTFEQCPTPDYLYTSRDAWFQHELEAHRSVWQCIAGCDLLSADESGFEGHVHEQHPQLASSSMLIALKRTARGTANTAMQASCPFCDMRMAVKRLKHHIGRHQEELALFALPSEFKDPRDEMQLNYFGAYPSVLGLESRQGEAAPDSSGHEKTNFDIDVSLIMEMLRRKGQTSSGEGSIPSESMFQTNTAKKRYQCGNCDESFYQKSHLEIHRRAHSSEKPFVCKTCGMSFSKRPNLKSHEIQHNTSSPERFSPSSFISFSASRDVSKEETPAFDVKGKKADNRPESMRPHTCDISGCRRATPGKGFSEMSGLQRHKEFVHRIGVERDSFQCASMNCRNRGKIWPRLDNFKQHISRMHKDEDEAELIRKSCYSGPTASKNLTPADMLAEEGISISFVTPGLAMEAGMSQEDRENY